MAEANPKPARAAPDSTALLQSALRTLEKSAALKLSALGPKAVRAALVSDLAQHGFEATSAFVRRPLALQLAAALADGAFMPLKSVASHTAGGTAAEAKQAALSLVRSGAARLVLRGSEEVVVPPNTAVLSQVELRRLGELLQVVTKAAKSKSGASLLEADVRESLAGVLPSLSSARPPRALTQSPPTPAAPAPFDGLLMAVEAARDARTGLSFVPTIVEKLGPQLGPETASTALLAAARAGLLELRPEGGINRLSAEELALCPEGPQGTRLSWARRTEVVTP